ncbi:eukaryotic translation initiation factor 5B-like [Stylophora pistillata]|uniref:eukaryotic translation initiation factor 5B-like n=1 Tax=Stylophora pistillata TaxID=50429 RepID=UPI000C0539D8|nr:eukaryotic translation initiation factor 5B-like [Stylophora pistillata]
MPWWKSSESQRRDFEVVIYEKDYKQLCAWVLKKTNIETGGDLFGLWADKHTAVIQFVVGPGKGCRRSSVSFYQDISYLEEIGSHMTKHEGVCHIGEWHSHHQLGLARPSGGDENTVWNNMPTYNLKRFVIFIANIESSRQNSYNVNIGCFLFELEIVKGKGEQLPVLQGTFKILPKESPFNGKLSEKRNEGAEKDNEKDIEMKDIKMEILPERPPLVIYAIKSSSSLRYKRHQPSDEKSGNQTANEKKKSKIDETATSAGDKTAQGNENVTPDDSKRGTATSDSNDRNDSHRSQKSSGVRKNDEGNAETSREEETNSAGDPQPPEKKKVHEVQPGNQQSEGDANYSCSASHNKIQEQKDGKVNEKPSEAECENSTDANDQNASNDKTQQGNPSVESNSDRREAKTEGGKSTDDPQHLKGDQNHEPQPPSPVLEGDATDHNASKDKTHEEDTSEKSPKDGAKALTEGGKSRKDAEPPHEEPNKTFDQVNKDQTSRPKEPVSVQGEAPPVEKQAKSMSQTSKGDANKHENPQNSLEDQTVQEKKSKVDKKDGGSARKEKQAKPVEEKKSKVDKKDGRHHGPPGRAKPQKQQAAKDAKKDSKGKGGSQKKDGFTAGTKL